MGRITDYDKLDKLNKDDAIVVETTNGTKHITRETLDSEYAFSPGKNIEIIDKEISVKASSLLSENDDGPISSKAVFESLNQKQNIIMNNVKNENQTTETDSKVQKTNEIDNTVTTMTNTSNESQKGYSEAKNVHNN